jgi:hypothetical protein
MPFVKLDCGILNSTLWSEKECREVFLTALLMAEPHELREPSPQIAVDSLQETGFVVPAGWYGFIHAAGVGILHRAGIGRESGMEALRRLGEPEETSRTPDFGGRRLVRVDGGYLVLNYMKYRDRDYTSAERSKRYRERVASRRVKAATHRDITQAEAEAEAEIIAPPSKNDGGVRGGVIASSLDFEKLKRHNAYIGARLRVPHKLHGDFVAALGGDNPDGKLRVWYAEVDAEIEVSREAIVPDVWKWMERRFKAWATTASAEDAMAKWVAGA